MVDVRLTLISFEPADTCNEMNQLTCIYQNIHYSQKFSKTVKALACLCSMENKAMAGSLNANKAIGFASCFISH